MRPFVLRYMDLSVYVLVTIRPCGEDLAQMNVGMPNIAMADMDVHGKTGKAM